MTHTLAKITLISLALVSLATPALAESPTERLLRRQQAEIQELRLQQQVQANQREIERIRRDLAGPQRPQVVVVERERRGPSLPGVLLGAALSNGYVDCYRGECNAGYGRRGSRWGRW